MTARQHESNAQLEHVHYHRRYAILETRKFPRRNAIARPGKRRGMTGFSTKTASKSTTTTTTTTTTKKTQQNFARNHPYSYSHHHHHHHNREQVDDYDVPSEIIINHHVRDYKHRGNTDLPLNDLAGMLLRQVNQALDRGVYDDNHRRCDDNYKEQKKKKKKTREELEKLFSSQKHIPKLPKPQRIGRAKTAHAA